MMAKMGKYKIDMKETGIREQYYKNGKGTTGKNKLGTLLW